MTVNAEPLLDASQIAANQAAITALSGAFVSHAADATIHWADAPNDGSSYVRNSLGWTLETVQAFGEYVGPFDASVGSFPVTTNQGDWFNCTVAGTVDGQAFIVGDILVATVDSPSTTTFAGNWSIVPNISVTDHTLLTNIGTNTHPQIDTHLADTSIHFADAPADAQDYVRNNNAWAVASPGGVTDHGALTGLADDDHLQYALLAGRAGGQTLNGGTLATQRLFLRGSSNADLGIVDMQSPAEFNVSLSAAVTPAVWLMRWPTTWSTNGAFIGGMIQDIGTVTYDNQFFIWSLLSETRQYIATVNPGFAAFTLFNALANIRNGGNFNLVNALVLNVGVTHERVTSGTSVAALVTGLNFSPQTKASLSGAIMTKTDQIAVNIQPSFSTVAGSTINMGNVCGMRVLNPIVALFQPASGIETLGSYIGMDWANITFGGNVLKAAVRSAQAAATNAYVILGTSSAQSELNGSLFFRTNLVGTVYGASDDLTVAWSGANFWFQQFNASADQLRWSNPSANRYILQTENGDSDGEFNMGFERYSFGQISAVGNQVGVFVAPTRTMTVGGGWSDFLLTQAGNITVDAAASQLFGWTLNAPSITLGTGSVTDAGGMLLGGNVSQGTNRYGLLILSNPTGGTINEALRVQTGRTRVADLFHEGTNLGFYGTAPIAKQLAVAVNAAAIHAALVALGLIT